MKRRDLITPAALVVLAAAALVYSYAVDRGRASDTERSARRNDLFPSFTVDKVKRIELTHGAERLVLERAGEREGPGAHAWRMTAPRDEPADEAAVDVLLRELELATRVRSVPADEAVGLDAPRARATIVVGTLTYELALGADAPRPEGAAYARLDGEGTFVVGRSLAVQLLRGVDAYRDRTLVPWTTDEIGRVEVREPDGRTFALERFGGTFRVAGVGLRADRDQVERLLRGLADARAEKFLDDAAADGATATGATVVTVDPKREGGVRVEIRFGGACPDEPNAVVALRTTPGRIASCVPRVAAESLRLDPAALVDERPLWARADEIAEIRLGAGTTRVEIARRGATWHERSPEDRDLTSDEAESATALALALANGVGAAARKPTPGEAFSPSAHASIVRAGGGTEEAVDVAAAGADGSALARRADDGALLRLPRSVARRFEPHPAALRTRAAWQTPFDPGAMAGVADDCGPAPQRIELGDAGSWVMRAPAGYTPDGPLVSELAEAIAHAKADAWIAETDDGAFGFAKPVSCAVTLVLGGPDAGLRRATLTFGAEGDGGVYARTSDDPAVFVVPRVVRDMASHPMIDRSPFRVDPAAAARITLMHDGAAVALSHDPDAGTERLAGALAAFSARAALHLGPAAPEEGLDHPTLEIRVGDRRITVGSPTRADEADAYFARVTGVDATFAVPKSAVAAVIGAL